MGQGAAGVVGWRVQVVGAPPLGGGVVEGQRGVVGLQVFGRGPEDAPADGFFRLRPGEDVAAEPPQPRLLRGVADELLQLGIGHRVLTDVAEGPGGHGPLAVLGGPAGQDDALDVGVLLANLAQEGDAVRLAAQVLVDEGHVIAAVVAGHQLQGGPAVGRRVHVEIERQPFGLRVAVVIFIIDEQQTNAILSHGLLAAGSSTTKVVPNSMRLSST